MEHLQSSSGTLTGAVTYRARIALLPGSIVSVQLQDMSEAAAPSPVLAETTVTTAGENVPIPFALEYEPEKIDAGRQYGLSARIAYQGQLLWVNSKQEWVLTGGAPQTGITIWLQRP